MKREKYGAANLGRLKVAMLHCPADSIHRVNEDNFKFYLYDNIPDCDNYIKEHNAYRDLLIQHGVEVLELSDFIVNNKVLMSYLPNLAYMNDIAVITEKGAVLSSMCSGGRQYEEVVVREAVSALGIPIMHACGPGNNFEGLIMLSPDTLFIAETERFDKRSIESFLSFALSEFNEVIYAEIPKARRFMHPDMIFNKVSDNLGLVFPPAFLNCWHITKEKRVSIDFIEWMKKRGIELIPVSDEEQQKWATSFVVLEPGVVINYDISLKSETVKKLESMGVRFIHFHPEALLAGGGSLRCLTLRIFRE
jgi:arginine deiminase